MLKKAILALAVMGLFGAVAETASAQRYGRGFRGPYRSYYSYGYRPYYGYRAPYVYRGPATYFGPRYYYGRPGYYYGRPFYGGYGYGRGVSLYFGF